MRSLLGQRRRRPPPWLPAALLAATLLVACGDATPEIAIEIPDLDTGWEGEPQVAAKIRAARAAALEEPTAARLGRLGMVFQAHELHQQAIDCYRLAAARSPEARWPYLAAISARKRDLEEAVTLFEEALGRGAKVPALHVHLGDVFAQLGRGDEAAAQYRAALELAPATSHARYGLAQLALARGDVETARDELERAIVDEPRHGEAHALLAQVYRRLGREDDARRALLRAGAHPASTATADPIFARVQTEAASSRSHTDRGRTLAARGDYAGAEKEFRRVLEIRPGNPRDHANLGGALAGQGKLDAAIAEYRAGLELDPDSVYTRNNLALALAEKGDLDGAVAQLERVVASDPTYAEAHHNLGLIHVRRGRDDEAIAAYRRALEHDPSLVAAYNDLGTAQAAGGDLEAAIESWRTAIELDPHRSLGALYNLAVALGQRGEHAEAVVWLRRGLELAPNSSRLVALLAWELATAPDDAVRDPAEAARLARRVHESYPRDPRFGDVLAAALAAGGRFDEAVEVARRAVEQARRGGNLQLAGQIRERLERYVRGEPYLQSAARS